MPTTRWTVRFEVAGKLTTEQIGDVMDPINGVFVFTNDAAPTTVIGMRIEADDYIDALAEAGRAFTELGAAQLLIRDRVIGQPHRVTAEAGDAPDNASAIISTKAAAEKLGVTDSRIRQLKDDPMFPRAITIPGAAGDFYYAVEIQGYKLGMVERPGRPRADDEDVLRAALEALLEDTTGIDVSIGDLAVLERAAESQGGRYVQGKAKVLVELGRRLGGEAIPFASPRGRESFIAGYRRAQQLYRP